MDYETFLNEVINRGIAGLCEHYPPESDHTYATHKDKREGGTAGFEACRDKSPLEISALLSDARDKKLEAKHNEPERYWWHRYFELEVEWVANVVSCSLHNQGLPTIIQPTARGMLMAASIVGVSEARDVAGS